MYPFKVSRLIQWALSGFTWRIDRPGKNIYLTFDDGPIPEATPWVLRRLEDFGAKATFFCVGHNIEKHPRVFERMVNAGHTPANHTFNHLSGFDVSAEPYATYCPAISIRTTALKTSYSVLYPARKTAR